MVTHGVILVVSIALGSKRTAVLLSVSCGPVLWAGHSWLWWSVKRVGVLIVGSQSASTVDWYVLLLRWRRDDLACCAAADS